MDALIRRATVGDAAGIAGVTVRGWQAGYAGLLPDAFLGSMSVADRADAWTEALRAPDPRSATLVADLAGAVAGFAHTGTDGTRGELRALYVEPDRWRTGLGRALHDAALDAMRGKGFDVATLWVLDTNIRGRQFYARLGWTPDGGQRAEPMGEIVLHVVRYTRPLTDR
ncbi:GNAT family N-acetyltransferase [Amycolatopsis suaedae]|uniref:GNAT family N-acetyltransferase n=1 Tax=Amycolatopsis suaedae TaxID=2510978 RepID=A0A4Q7JEF6_9PSEU|nr:GNAT family N-acetyltransferase [Amycolatopsis suaedae]RZQ65879.1 GNAT family N-acetyltransferase [Amycolatopsis suaedae]